MGYKRKSWQEKLQDKKNFPSVHKLQKNFPCYNSVHKMGAEVGDDVVLANPSEIVDEMKQVPEGKLTSIVDICKKISSRHGVKACCSLTTGIFIMTAANAVEEATLEGKRLNIPYWRTLKADGQLNAKYPDGVEGHKKLLESEGHTVVKKGRKFYVKDFTKFLV